MTTVVEAALIVAAKKDWGLGSLRIAVMIVTVSV